LSANAREAFGEGRSASGFTGAQGAGAGLANFVRSGVERVSRRMRSGGSGGADGGATSSGRGASVSNDAVDRPPDWAARLQRRQHIAHGATAAAQVLRSADHGGGGTGPHLDQGEEH
jgi:type IV secretion system protein TrbL